MVRPRIYSNFSFFRPSTFPGDYSEPPLGRRKMTIRKYALNVTLGTLNSGLFKIDSSSELEGLQKYVIFDDFLTIFVDLCVGGTSWTRFEYRFRISVKN